jgi:hypothetical protein
MLSHEHFSPEHQAAFARLFRSKVEEVVAPSFDLCVRSLHQHGIRAQQVNKMNRNHPNISLDITYNRSNCCKFVLTPMQNEEKVGLRLLVCKERVWSFQDTTRVEMEQVTENLLREKLQEAINVLDDE